MPVHTSSTAGRDFSHFLTLSDHYILGETSLAVTKYYFSLRQYIHAG